MLNEAIATHTTASSTAQLMSDLELRLADILRGIYAARQIISASGLHATGDLKVANAAAGLEWIAEKLEADAHAAMDIVSDRQAGAH